MKIKERLQRIKWEFEIDPIGSVMTTIILIVYVTAFISVII